MSDKDLFIQNNLKDSFTTPIFPQNDRSYSEISISSTLKCVRSRSLLKQGLSNCLGFFYSYPFLLITIEFLIGFICFSLPILLIHFCGLLGNIIFSFLIIAIFSFIFSLSLIIIRIIDDKKHKLLTLANWQRENLFSNLGMSFFLLPLIVIILLGINYYNILLHYKDNDLIRLIPKENVFAENLDFDFLMKYVLDLFLIDLDKIYDDFNSEVGYNIYINKDDIYENFRDQLFVISIPLFIICIFKLIKVIFIAIKYTFENFCSYSIGFLFSILCMVLRNINADQIENKKSIISIFELILIISFYITYISWIIHNVVKKIKNPKESSFGIRLFPKKYIIVILFFDALIFIGSCLIFISFIVYYSKYIKGSEKFITFIISCHCLKSGFALFIIGIAYYYGHYIMGMIFKPIVGEFIPAELENEYYIKVKRNYCFINTMRKKLLFKKQKKILISS